MAALRDDSSNDWVSESEGAELDGPQVADILANVTLDSKVVSSPNNLEISGNGGDLVGVDEFKAHGSDPGEPVPGRAVPTVGGDEATHSPKIESTLRDLASNVDGKRESDPVVASTPGESSPVAAATAVDGAALGESSPKATATKPGMAPLRKSGSMVNEETMTNEDIAKLSARIARDWGRDAEGAARVLYGGRAGPEFLHDARRSERAELAALVTAQRGARGAARWRALLRRLVYAALQGLPAGLYAALATGLAAEDLLARKSVYDWLAEPRDPAALLTLNSLHKDARSRAAKVRALAVRSLSKLARELATEHFLQQFETFVKDPDAYVRMASLASFSTYLDVHCRKDLEIDSNNIYFDNKIKSGSEGVTTVQPVEPTKTLEGAAAPFDLGALDMRTYVGLIRKCLYDSDECVVIVALSLLEKVGAPLAQTEAISLLNRLGSLGGPHATLVLRAVRRAGLKLDLFDVLNVLEPLFLKLPLCALWEAWLCARRADADTRRALAARLLPCVLASEGRLRALRALAAPDTRALLQTRLDVWLPGPGRALRARMCVWLCIGAEADADALRTLVDAWLRDAAARARAEHLRTLCLVALGRPALALHLTQRLLKMLKQHLNPGEAPPPSAPTSADSSARGWQPAPIIWGAQGGTPVLAPEVPVPNAAPEASVSSAVADVTTPPAAPSVTISTQQVPVTSYEDSLRWCLYTLVWTDEGAAKAAPSALWHPEELARLAPATRARALFALARRRAAVPLASEILAAVALRQLKALAGKGASVAPPEVRDAAQAESTDAHGAPPVEPAATNGTGQEDPAIRRRRALWRARQNVDLPLFMLAPVLEERFPNIAKALARRTPPGLPRVCPDLTQEFTADAFMRDFYSTPIQ